MKSIGFVGGNLRQLTLLRNFQSIGYSVKIFGYSGAPESAENIEDVFNSDLIVFPMPTCSGDRIFAPFYENPIYIKDLQLPAGKIIFYAGSGNALYEKLVSSGSLCFDYLKRDELAIKNAIPTAEGAVEIAMNETAHSIFGSNVLITGFGRVAKALARTLKGLDAEVTVAARKYSALAEAQAIGCHTIKLEHLNNRIGEFELIFNTIPALIIDEERLSKAKEDALIIDLASKPGGIDFNAAKKLSKRVIWALSLPGKIAPVTAGNIIFDTIMNILSETEVTDNGFI